MVKKSIALTIVLALLIGIIPATTTFAAAPIKKSDIKREDVVKLIELVNDNWISKNPNHGRAFWDNAAYHTGNMEAYVTTGIEAYREYSEAWAKQNQWKGAKSDNKANWKYTYGESDDYVLFGDWQICFQTYIDLYNFDVEKDPNKIARAIEVMEYQMSTGKNDYWWWADGLYMVMPVMTKLYLVTQNPQYLDKLYEWYRYAKSIMYDGPDGYPGASDYTYLFHRDGKYIYPQHKTDNGKKDFWARGQGWVFAGLAKVLNDLPSDWEHRAYFENDYKLMAKTIASCQMPEGYWTRSMMDPNHVTGYETSGTAFFLYGFLWGINNGILDEAEYADTVLKAYHYLTTIAISDKGVVGYVQPIGENAKQHGNLTQNSTSNFGVGATLLALSEMARWVGGLGDGDLYPYLQRKLMGTVSLQVDKPHVYANSKISHIDEADHSINTVIVDGRTLVPVRVISEKFGAKVDWDEATRTITVSDEKNKRTIKMTLDQTEYTVNGEKKELDVVPTVIKGRTFIPLRAMAEALGKFVYWNPQYKIITISHKENLFDDTRDAKLLEMLNYMLQNDKYPARPEQFKDFSPKIAPKSEFEYTPKKVEGSVVPEPENGPMNAVDGDLSTRYAGNGANPTLTIDYGDVVDVGQVAIAFWKSESRTTNYELDYSADGQTWVNIYKGNSTQGNTYDVFDVNAKLRYIRVIGHGNTENEWTSILEVEAYKPNAPKKSAKGTASGTTSTTNTIQTTNQRPSGSKLTIASHQVSQEPEPENNGRNAYDGNKSTFWASEGQQNIVLDLGSAKNVTGVGVAFRLYEDDRTIPFRVFISTDKSNWTKIYEGKSVPRSNEFIWASLPQATSVRYVKVECDGNSVSGWTSLAEVEIYGN